MSKPETRYIAYLVRMWSTNDAQGEVVWRASIQSPGETARRGFESLESLFVFLRQECKRSESSESSEPDAR